MPTRIEKDFLGQKEIPMDAYWGIHTQRAIDNFRITGTPVEFDLIKSLAMVKKACCLANQELGLLAEEKAQAIQSACEEIILGKYQDQFPVDALQGGAGTSTNMNVNEVIANRAIELMGGTKGDYAIVHPVEEVNLHQSTNDTYPTALKVAAIFKFRELSQKIAELQGVFQKKEKEFAAIVKIGRTELQEAVPITLGAEFGAFAEAIARDRWRTFKSEERLRVINLGGTAVGTGLTAPRSYIFLVTEKLRDITGLGLTRGENVLDQTANADCFVEVSGMLKAHASNLIKIADDLRLMNLLGEIELPKVQPGSSIMPQKVNPVILEAAIQTGLKVIGNDLMITEAASRSSFQINEFMPVIAHALLNSLKILVNINGILTSHIELITAKKENNLRYVDTSPMIITAFLPHIGYEKATALLQEFNKTGSNNLRDYLTEKLGKELVDRVLSPENLVSLGYRDHENNA
ncbi:MAG: aspartate ammonia-lyase [bacterium]